MVKQIMRIFFRVALLVILSFLFSKTIIAQSFSDRTFLIEDLSEGNLSEAIIRNELRTQWTGLSIKLDYNNESGMLVLLSGTNSLSFEKFALILKEFIGNNNQRLLPVFIDYTGPVRLLNDAIISNELSEYIYYHPPGERWPGESEIIDSKRNLIFFTFQQPNSGNVFFHYAWDYIAEFPHSGSEDPLFDGHFINGTIENELLLIRDFQIPSQLNNQNRLIVDINQNQYYINHLLNRWKNTGKQPNFIFVGRSSRFLSPLIPWLYTYKSIKGIVRVNDKPMRLVYWKHSNKCITNGYFSFPYSEGEELNLTPFSPGFGFDPQTSVISTENLLLSVTFNANPLFPEEGLVAYFPFDQDWKNYMDETDKTKPVGAVLTSDINMGEVAKLPENSYIIIGKPERYGIRNNSFSVSTWFKVNELESRDDYSILGTQEGVFRKGLHLVIRQRRPYFGFYGNDLWADRIITANEWFHIVFRYNYFNGEQAIFVNGQSVGSSFNHASFIGDSALVIGKSINSANFLNGFIDDLYIWNRPIGEEEIQFLYENDFKPLVLKKKQIGSAVWIIPFALILLLAMAWLGIRFRKKFRKDKSQPMDFDEQKNRLTNSLFLFGDFQIYNNSGEELSPRFTPKIQELFMLVVLFTIKNKKGIKTEKLTSLLWPGFPIQKAANNRSVSINKLRKIITNVKGLVFEYDNGYWKVKFKKGFYCDYIEAVAILEKDNDPSKRTMEDFFKLVKKGVFLNELEWEWLEEFKGYMVNEIIDKLTFFASKLNEKEDCHLLKAIAGRILIIDDLNEQALQIVIRQLIQNNNSSQARFRFSQFKDLYEKSYGEPYRFSFDEFTEISF